MCYTGADAQMKFWDAYTHLLTHERDVEKAKLHMRRVMEFLIKIWFTMIVED